MTLSDRFARWRTTALSRLVEVALFDLLTATSLVLKFSSPFRMTAVGRKGASALIAVTDDEPSTPRKI